MRRRPAKFAFLVTLVAAAWALTACAGPMKQQRLNTSQIPHPELEQIVGLTTITGEDIQFDPTGGRYAEGSILGKVKSADFRISIDHVQRLWVLRRGVSTSAPWAWWRAWPPGQRPLWG